MKRKTRWDWPQVALVAIVGGLGLAAAVVLDVTWEKVAAVHVEQWTLIASAVAGVVGTLTAALRRPMVEAHTIRERDTPEAP